MVPSAKPLMLINYTRIRQTHKTEHEPAPAGNAGQIVHRDEAELKKKLIFVINEN